MKKIILSLAIFSFTSVALANSFPVLICDADLAGSQFLIDMNTHTVYEIKNGVPASKRVVEINDTRESSGDTVTYKLAWGTELTLSDQGEDPNSPWSLYSEDAGYGECKGR